MFQGSAHVGKAEHMALVQAAGGTLNGTTWLDRTNYFETMPSHQLELALWLEADRMGTLLDALSQENLDNQREVVKNEKRWSYDNRPYGSWNEKLLGAPLPGGHPYHHPTIGSMEDLDAASVEDVKAFFRTYYAPEQCRALRGRRRRPGRRSARGSSATSARSRPTRTCRPLPDMSLPPTLGGEIREVVAGPGAAAAHPLGLPRPASSATRGSTRSTSPARSSPGGKGSRLHRRLVREERLAQDVAALLDGPRRRRVDHRRLGDRPPGRRPRRASRPLLGGAGADGPRAASSADELARAKALTEADELGALPASRGAGRSAVDVRDAVRRPGPDQQHPAALPVDHRRADPAPSAATCSGPTTGSCSPTCRSAAGATGERRSDARRRGGAA